MQTPLDDLVSWYVEHCDGEWEHSYGVTLDTLDNPGWSLKVDLKETRLEGVAMERTVSERTEDDWIQAWSDGVAFYAAGGPTNLHEIVAAFADFAAGA